MWREEGALEGLGVGYEGSWGSDSPGFKFGLALGVLAKEQTRPFPLQEADDSSRTRLFGE